MYDNLCKTPLRLQTIDVSKIQQYFTEMHNLIHIKPLCLALCPSDEVY